MDWEIGEIRQIKDEWYQCLEDTNNCCDCDNYCDLYQVFNYCQIACTSGERIDNKSVYFKKLEKVGEPIVYMNRTFQRLKSIDSKHCKYCYFGNQVCNIHLCGEKLFLVEIKKDIKEDMKEKKLNLKPFDIQKAKEGKPVCTRDGRSVRILCFDRIGNLPIIALVKNREGETVYYYYNNGRDNKEDVEKDYDLLMKPIIKTGWINVHKENGLYKTEEDAKKNQLNDDFVAVKVEFEV